jgi:hypothetical protein
LVLFVLRCCGGRQTGIRGEVAGVRNLPEGVRGRGDVQRGAVPSGVHRDVDEENEHVPVVQS